MIDDSQAAKARVTSHDFRHRGGGDVAPRRRRRTRSASPDAQAAAIVPPRSRRPASLCLHGGGLQTRRTSCATCRRSGGGVAKTRRRRDRDARARGAGDRLGTLEKGGRRPLVTRGTVHSPRIGPLRRRLPVDSICRRRTRAPVRARRPVSGSCYFPITHAAPARRFRPAFTRRVEPFNWSFSHADTCAALPLSRRSVQGELNIRTADRMIAVRLYLPGGSRTPNRQAASGCLCREFETLSRAAAPKLRAWDGPREMIVSASASGRSARPETRSSSSTIFEPVPLVRHGPTECQRFDRHRQIFDHRLRTTRRRRDHSDSERCGSFRAPPPVATPPHSALIAVIGGRGALPFPADERAHASWYSFNPGQRLRHRVNPLCN